MTIGIISEAVYKKKFRQWGLKKNVSNAFALEAFQKRKEREDAGRPETELLINGKPVADAKIARHVQRHKRARVGVSGKFTHQKGIRH